MSLDAAVDLLPASQDQSSDVLIAHECLLRVRRQFLQVTSTQRADQKISPMPGAPHGTSNQFGKPLLCVTFLIGGAAGERS